MTMLTHPQQAPESYSMVKSQGFAGISNYLKRCELKGEIRQLSAELSDVKAAQPDNATVLHAAIDDLPNLEEEIIKRLGAHLHEHRRSKHSLSSRYDQLMQRIGAVSLTEDLIRKAVEKLPEPPGRMPTEKKQKEVSRLEKLIQKKKSELEKYSPPDAFLWRDGAPVQDLYDDLERKWRSIQGRLNSPANIQGITLDACDAAEQKAWRDLGIRSAMRTDSNMAPYMR